MKAKQAARRLALYLCLVMFLTACAGAAAIDLQKFQPPDRNPRATDRIVPNPIRGPLPTNNYIHVTVNSGQGSLPVYDNTRLSGTAIGRLKDGEIITVRVFTQDVGMVVAHGTHLDGGYVRLSLLEEIPDENSFPEGDPYRAVITADPLIPGPVVI